MSFQENLREILDSKDLQHKDLVRMTGIPLKTIENYFKQKPSTPSVDNALNIAQALGVTVEELVNGQKNGKSDVIGSQNKNTEIFATLSKLNKYNYEVITSIAKTLLDIQIKKNQN